jgi:hypothetical protein
MDETKEFLRLRARLIILKKRLLSGKKIDMVAYRKLAHTAFRLGQKISKKKSLKNALNNAKKISAATRIQRAFRQKIRTNKQFLDEYRKLKRSTGNLEEGEIPENVNIRKLTNYADRRYGTENLNFTRNMIVNKMHGPAKKIQQAFRKSRLTNAQLIKLWNIQGQGRRVTNAQLLKMNSRSKRITGRYNIEGAVEAIREMRNSNVKAVPSVTKIQSIFRGYKSRNINPRREFLLSLSKDGRFEYYVEVLARLEYRVQNVLDAIYQNIDPVSAITGRIGVCHYKARPSKIVQNVTNVRRNILQLKKKTPREYLQSFRKQFAYVAKKYSQFTTKQKELYRNNLNSYLSAGQPCLENLLDYLVQALLIPTFVWIGKTKNLLNNPLQQNNIRYLGYGPSLGKNRGVVNTAIKSWHNSLKSGSNKKPEGWNNMSIDNKKNIFWKMIKNKSMYVYTNEGPVNATPNYYNKNGVKFKSSNLANTLNYI